MTRPQHPVVRKQSARSAAEADEYTREHPTKNVQAPLDHIGRSGDPILWGEGAAG